MRKAKVVCLQRRHYVITTKSKPGLPVAENRLQRQFNVDAPNRVWTVDITYLSTQEGGLYLAIVLDLFSRRIIGWCLDEYLRETLAGNALQMALTRRTPTGSLMHHSDRGCQYTSAACQARNCYDNAVAERFFGSLKSERTDQEIYSTRTQAKSAVIDYTSQRLHSTLGYRTPIHYEQAHGFS
ncbi:MAG: IS3 family transposase [Candidatus Symbiodolus clandestinus]